MKMTVTLHMAIAIPYLRHFLQQSQTDGEPQEAFTDVGYEDAFAYLNQLEADGFEFVPACDDYDQVGRCRGHKKEVNDETL